MAALVLIWLRPVNPRGVTSPTEIYQGVWYSCEPVDSMDGSRGMVHLIKVDLKAPGVQIYATPLDPSATSQGAQYRLTFAKAVANQQNLAVLINGTLFDAGSRWALPGALASSNETMIAQGVVNHVHAHSYLLWFDRELIPRLETSKPPSRAALDAAWWGISGQGVALHQGKVSAYAGHEADARTMIGIDPSRRLLWLAVFEHASGHVAARTFAAAGATEAILVDGGSSSTMVIGAQAHGIEGGYLFGGHRPVATFFGVRAAPLHKP